MRDQLLNPRAPGFDTDVWQALPHADRLRAMSRTWADQGFGAPLGAYLFYVTKLVVYVGGFVIVAGLTEPGGMGEVATWWATPSAFTKAIVWTLLWESVGLGCGSGPLTGRYLPPVTAVAHWLRPGTVRLAPWPWLPGTGGSRRQVVDVALYLAFVGFGVRVLATSQPAFGDILPVVALLAVAGLRDKAVFLSGRSEHYLLALLVAGLTIGAGADTFWAAEKWIMVGLWLGAATSKLNLHFPGVMSVMLANNPLLRSPRLRRRLYRDYPDDLRPSRASAWIAHGATVVEYSFPIMLLLGAGGWVTTVALVVMVAFHLAILTSFPLGVPLEWNVFFIYAGLVLFGVHADVRAWAIDASAATTAAVVVALVVGLVVLPVVGNLRPDMVSFLPSMRYYAGNWACSLWLLRPGVLERIDDALPTAARTPRRQVERLYGDGVFEVVLGRTQAFRSMHLHGRALNSILPLAVPEGRSIDDYEVTDGELVAGLVVGWNFGDGHLHHEQLLAAITARCTVEPGDIRAVLLESQPAGSPWLAWRVVDGATGPVCSGRVRAADLLDAQPWDLDPARVEVAASDPARLDPP